VGGKALRRHDETKTSLKTLPKYPICPYSPAHTGCVSESIRL